MDDDTIVQMYWDRDENAIYVTSQKYGRYCLSIARNILGNHQDAEECVNDTYINTWNSIPTNRPKLLSTYLGKIVRNLSFNLYKRNKAQKRGEGQMTLVLDELSELIADPNSSKDQYDSEFLTELINTFLEDLPVEKRKIFVCRYWYADSIKDIANRFNMSENSVSVTLNRLRAKLSKFLIENGYQL